jgi:hypothetical protein
LPHSERRQAAEPPRHRDEAKIRKYKDNKKFVLDWKQKERMRKHPPERTIFSSENYARLGIERLNFVFAFPDPGDGIKRQSLVVDRRLYFRFLFFQGRFMDRRLDLRLLLPLLFLGRQRRYSLRPFLGGNLLPLRRAQGVGKNSPGRNRLADMLNFLLCLSPLRFLPILNSAKIRNYS